MTTPLQSDLTGGAGSLSEATSPGASEAVRYAPAVPPPDAAAIARMANAFYAARRRPPIPGPGAALPSAPVFAAEPMYRSLPGLPALRAAAVAEPQPRAAADADPVVRRGATVSAGVRRGADARSDPIAFGAWHRPAAGRQRRPGA